MRRAVRELGLGTFWPRFIVEPSIPRMMATAVSRECWTLCWPNASHEGMMEAADGLWDAQSIARYLTIKNYRHHSGHHCRCCVGRK